MSTAGTTAGGGVRAAADRYGFGNAARMEWIKLRTLRSTLWALLATTAGMIAIGLVTMANTKAPGPGKAATFDPVNNLLAGVALGQLIIGALGVLAVTGEYSSGSIRATLAAVPRRPLLLAAKAAVLGAAALVVGEVVVFVTFFAGRPLLTRDVPSLSLADPGVLRAVVMSGAYLAMVGLIGVGLGAVVRHTAAAIGALVGFLYVVPGVLGGLTGTVVAKFLPTIIAGNSLAAAKPVSGCLSPWTGFAVLTLYVALVLLAGSLSFSRRNA